MIKFLTPHPSAKDIKFPKSKVNAVVRHGASKKAILAQKRFPVEINSIEAIRNCADKHKMKELLSAANITTTESFANTEENRALFKRNKWNAVYKKLNHRRGIGMEFLPLAEIDKLADPQYNGLIERRINVKREWRVHACPLLKETYPLEKRRRKDAQGPARNIENCVFREMENAPPPPDGWMEALTLCMNSVSALGLDTGAVDLAWSGTKFYVIEVNSGPGLGDKSRNWYQNIYTRLVEEKTK